ncbi:helix-turn-helix domain-containing protein [Shewanella sp. 202IG2-18]|uniref:helix-turn-helix domain-containing protein n=1 Tax=Parashewanella hymeniacidonis TaxID=2807618 RepID=UPI00195FD2B4|nr:helix-turn-helix domain-containing protein [Parashewanella hymeniacidonis]MBM7070915.1 helix-turn-helix domain-containing protein [Parashewanella hymeniacidonis]
MEITQIWYSKTQLAEYFGVHVKTLREWRNEGKMIEPEQQGLMRNRYDIRKVETFLKEQSGEAA